MRRSVVNISIAIAVVAVTTNALPASAQVGELPAHEEGKPLLALELGIFGDPDYLGVADVSVFHLSPLVRFFYPVMPNLMLSADWGFTYASIEDADGDSASDFRTGNIFLGAHYVRTSPERRFRIGGGLTLPIANIPDIETASDVEDAFAAIQAYGVAILARGAWDIWLWAPETMSLVVPFRLEQMIRPAIEVATDAAFAILIPIADNDGDTELLLQAAGEVAFWVNEAIRLGFRLQFAWVATEDDAIFEDDNFQLSFEPFIRGYLGRGFLQARLVINIDEPAGFAFDDDGVWGLFLGGGLTF